MSISLSLLLAQSAPVSSNPNNSTAFLLKGPQRLIKPLIAPMYGSKVKMEVQAGKAVFSFFCFGLFGQTVILDVPSEGGMSQSQTALACSLFFKLQLSRSSELSSSNQCLSKRSYFSFFLSKCLKVLVFSSKWIWLPNKVWLREPLPYRLFSFSLFQAALPCYNSCVAKAGRLLDFLSLPDEHHLASSQKT